MSVSISNNRQQITAGYSAATIATDNSPENTKVIPPKTAKDQPAPVVDDFEQVTPTGIQKGTAAPAPGVLEKNPDLPNWIQKEKKAYDNAMARMANGEQNLKNSCGTTSEANALSFFGLPFSHTLDYKFIDQSIRPWQLGPGTPTAPGDIVAFARQLGMQARQYNKCDLEDVARQLRAGHTVTVVTDWQGNCVHYVNIIGVDRDPVSGEIVQVHIRNTGGVEVEDQVRTAEDFMEMWSNVRAYGENGNGFVGNVLKAFPICDRTMIVLDTPDGEKLESSSLWNNLQTSNANVVLNGVNGLSAGVNAMKSGAVMAGIGQVTGSFINTVVGGSCYIVGELIGKNIEDGGDKLMAVGKEMLNGNTWHKIGGGLAIFFGAIAKAIGWLLETITNFVSAGTDWLTNLLSKSAEKHNARKSLADALNADAEDYSGKGRKYYLENASRSIKKEMFELLAHDGKPSQDEQRAAYQVLKYSYRNGDIHHMVQDLGGKEKVCGIFQEPTMTAVKKLLENIG